MMAGTILLVEDNPLDIKATLNAAEKLRIASHVDVVNDGVSALAFLRRDRRTGPRPSLVLLDLNLPGKDGSDVLAEMKSDPDLRRIPVIVLTTSADDRDVIGSYDLGANAVLTKPIGLDDWLEVASKIKAFWLDVARLPQA